MSVPLTYNFRNLVERKGTTLMTAVGIGLTVAVLVISVALTIGLKGMFSASGDPRQFLVLRQGSDSELNSTISGEAYQIVRRLPGIAVDEHGEPLVSPESITVVNLPSVDSPEGMNVTVRGLLPIGYAMRPVEVLAGQKPAVGLRQVMVGESVARRYPAARIGKQVRFGKGLWNVVGVFKSGESAANSEMWTDLDQLRGDFEQRGGSSSLLVRAQIDADEARQQIAVAAKADAEAKKVAARARADAVAQGKSPIDVPAAKPVEADFLRAFGIDDDQRLGAQVVSEKKYYDSLTSAGIPLMGLGYAVAVIMAIGSGFAATNTMYAAVARRRREIGTLRAIGFGRAAILRSFVIESVFLALVGGVLGVLLALPVNGLTTAVGNFSTFSETAFKFRVDAFAIAMGLLFAVLIGFIGGLLPAWAAARTGIVAAMREG